MGAMSSAGGAHVVCGHSVYIDGSAGLRWLRKPKNMSGHEADNIRSKFMHRVRHDAWARPDRSGCTSRLEWGKSV